MDVIIVDNGSTQPGVREFLDSLVNTEVIYLDKNYGTAEGLNVGLHRAMELGYDYFQLSSNDVLEPENWISMKLRYLEQFPAGMVSINPTGFIKTYNYVIQPSYCHVIGQFMITRATVERVGYFCTTYSRLYAPIDNDYNTRCNKLGLLSYYIPMMESKHFGQHGADNKDNEYGYVKRDHLAITWNEFVTKINSDYTFKSGCYLPFQTKTNYGK